MYPIKPESKFFIKPNDLIPGYGTTVTDEGHIFGYLALFNARLIGSGNKNTRPPRSRSNYSYANAYSVKCSDDSVVRTGVIAGVGGHKFSNGFKLTQEAYADVRNKIANVVYGEDEHGVWFTGALVSSVDEAMVQTIRSSGVSGHWERPENGKAHELLGSVLVNVPGFAQAAEQRIVANATITPNGGLTIQPILVEADKKDIRSIKENFRVAGAGNRIIASASLLRPISGILAALGTPTSDGRQVNDVVWKKLPLPLWALNEQGEYGHTGAKIVGRIDDITIEGQLVKFRGMIEEGLPHGDDVKLISDLGVLGISMDGKLSDGFDVVYEYEDDDENFFPSKITFEQYEILGATLTSEPAFQETIGVTVGEDGVVEPATDNEEDSTPSFNGVSSEVEEDSDVTNSSNMIENDASGYSVISLPIIWQKPERE